MHGKDIVVVERDTVTTIGVNVYLTIITYVKLNLDNHMIRPRTSVTSIIANDHSMIGIQNFGFWFHLNGTASEKWISRSTTFRTSQPWYKHRIPL